MKADFRVLCRKITHFSIFSSLSYTKNIQIHLLFALFLSLFIIFHHHKNRINLYIVRLCKLFDVLMAQWIEYYTTNHPDCGLESGSYQYLWDLFPTGDVVQPCVTSADIKQLYDRSVDHTQHNCTSLRPLIREHTVGSITGR